MLGKILVFFLLVFLRAGNIFALDELITVPAEDPRGVVLDLEKNEYMVTIDGGAIALFYPINPNYRWLISVAAGSGVEGGQDEPDIGMIYFEPNPPVHTQAEAEAQALAAVKQNAAGTSLKFILSANTKVRFWVSDFDYTDNSGMVKLNIRSTSKT